MSDKKNPPENSTSDPDAEIVENLDLLESMDVLESETEWDVISDVDKVPQDESEDSKDE